MASTDNLIVRKAQATERIKAALGTDLPRNKGPEMLRHTLDLEAIAAALEARNTSKSERKDQ